MFSQVQCKEKKKSKIKQNHSKAAWKSKQFQTF